MKSKMYEIHCDHCDSEWMVKCETIVHAQNEKSLKSRILEESFFTRKCSKCGKLISFYYPFLYCDMEKKYLIALADEHTKWIEELDKLDQYHDFNKRMVTNEWELKEKINIFDAGLSDYGIASIKERLKHLYSTFYFQERDENGLLWFHSDKGMIAVEERFYVESDLNDQIFTRV